MIELIEIEREVIRRAAIAVDNASDSVKAFVAGLIAAGPADLGYRDGVIAGIYRARRTRSARSRQEYQQ